MTSDTTRPAPVGSDYLAASRRLATAIRESPPFKCHIGAQQHLDENAEAAGILADYQKAVQHLQSLQQWGGAKKEDQQHVEVLQTKLLANEIIVEFLRAQDELVQMLRETNALISERLDVDFARLAKPAKGCC